MYEPPEETAESLRRVLARERISNARRNNAVRFWGVSAFFLLFLVLGGILGRPEWSGNLGLFTVYWLASAVVYFSGRRSERLTLASHLAIPLFDAPVVFFLQWATMPTSNPSGVAGFTVGIYVLLLVLASFALQRWFVVFTAVVVGTYEVLLQYFANVSGGAMASTAILISLAAFACLYAQYRLLRFLQRADRHLRGYRKAEAARRQARRVTALASLARDLSVTLDPASVAPRTVQSIVRLLNATTAVLFRFEPAGGTLVAAASTGVMRDAFPVGTVIPGDSGAVGLAVTERRVVTSPDVLNDARLAMPGTLQDRVLHSDHRAACAVPLVVRHLVIGALGVGDVAGRVFTDDEIALAQAFAEHAAFSLDNAQLYAQVEGQLRQLEATQQQLLQAGKLAAVGQLATGVAHEVNNPLATIMGQTEMIKRRITDPALAERVGKIADSALRASQIVRKLQTFVKPGVQEMGAVDVGAIIQAVLSRRLEAQRHQGLELVREVPDSVPRVMGDAGQLEQVILTLVQNAEEALAGAAVARITVTVRAGDDGRLRITVADSGPGIPPDILPRVFEPFFTTKAPNQHSGLGLSIAYSIVQHHAGRLTVESTPGSGTRFALELPTVAAVPAEDPALPASPPILAKARVLVVDDSPEVASMLRELLEDLGMEVTVSGDATAAWRILDERHAEFDAVMLDMRLPDVSGPVLYERISARLPSLAERVVFVTGDHADVELDRFIAGTGRPSLQKPFDVERLIRSLSFLLVVPDARPLRR